MASKYKMLIVNEDDEKVAEFAPGLAIEMEFVDECVSRIVGKGVGFTKTSTHVAQAIRDGIEEAIYDLKRLVNA